MKKIAAFLFALSLVQLGLAADVQIGMSEDQLLAVKGSPVSKAALGGKSIYRWADMEVIVIEKKVSEIKVRDRTAEKDAAQERALAKAKQEAKDKQAAAAAKKEAREETQASKKAENAEDARLERIVTLQAYIARMERELAADDKRSSFGKGPPPMSAEARALLVSRIENAKREIQSLR